MKKLNQKKSKNKIIIKKEKIKIKIDKK